MAASALHGVGDVLIELAIGMGTAQGLTGSRWYGRWPGRPCCGGGCSRSGAHEGSVRLHVKREQIVSERGDVEAGWS